jgi:hypothetical protein
MKCQQMLLLFRASSALEVARLNEQISQQFASRKTGRQ